MIEGVETILITCAAGLDAVLRREVAALGFEITQAHETGVLVRGTFADAQRLNLCLRTAYNVLILLREFRCTSPRNLSGEVGRVRWEELIPPDEYLCVVSRVDHPSIDNSMFANQKVKDAIVDRLKRKTGRRPDAGPERDNVVLFLRWRGDLAQLFVNTSGRKLSDRTYRKLPHHAPLRETLAAALLLEAGYDGKQPLVNPMCGSGTLAIEAALLATARAPGLLRPNFGFMHLKPFDGESFSRLRAEIRRESAKEAPAPIVATDLDEEALAAARKNALTAGVDHLIDFQACDFAETPLPAPPGIVIMNPAYGVRVGDVSQLEETYARIGDFFKTRCAGYAGYVFTGNLDLAKKIGLRARRRVPFWNGDLECRLLAYELYTGSRKKPSAA